MMSIGSTIKKLRNVNNVSQKEMSEKLGVSCQTISKWENKKAYPDIEMLPEIADFFHVTIDTLFQGNVDDSNNAEYSEKYYSAHRARFINYSFVIKARKRS